MPLEGSIVPAGTPAAPPPVSNPIPVTSNAPPAPAPETTPAPAAAAAPQDGKPAEETPKAPPVDSWRLAALSQKEKAIRETAAQAKADREAAAAEREAVRREREVLSQREAVYRQDPMRLLQDYGYDYNTVTQYVAQGGWSPEQVAAAREAARDQAIRELAQRQAKDREDFAAQREADRKAAEEAQAKAEAEAHAQAVAEFKGEIASFVSAAPDDYEMIRLAGPQAMEQVFDRIKDHFEKTGQQLPTKEAADAVEKALVEEAEKVIEQSKKLRSKFAPPAPPAGPPVRTLSNSLKPGSGVAPPPAAPGSRSVGGETEEQRRARVIGNIERAWGRK